MVLWFIHILNMVSLQQFKGMQSVCERGTICQYNAYERGKFSGKNGTLGLRG